MLGGTALTTPRTLAAGRRNTPKPSIAEHYENREFGKAMREIMALG